MSWAAQRALETPITAETDVSISAFPLSQRGTEKEPRAATRAHELWANVTGLYVT